MEKYPENRKVMNLVLIKIVKKMDTMSYLWRIIANVKRGWGKGKLCTFNTVTHIGHKVVEVGLCTPLLGCLQKGWSINAPQRCKTLRTDVTSFFFNAMGRTGRRMHPLWQANRTWMKILGPLCIDDMPPQLPLCKVLRVIMILEVSP